METSVQRRRASGMKKSLVIPAMIIWTSASVSGSHHPSQSSQDAPLLAAASVDSQIRSPGTGPGSKAPSGEAQRNLHDIRSTTSPFNEKLDVATRLARLAEFSASNDPATLEVLVVHLDVPFLDPDKQNILELGIADEYQTFPCRGVLRQKGESAVPALLKELAHPTPSPSEWSRQFSDSPLRVLEVLRSIVGYAKLGQLLGAMHPGDQKVAALALYRKMDRK